MLRHINNQVATILRLYTYCKVQTYQQVDTYVQLTLKVLAQTLKPTLRSDILQDFFRKLNH
jgi:hypothetical protein